MVSSIFSIPAVLPRFSVPRGRGHVPSPGAAPVPAAPLPPPPQTLLVEFYKGAPDLVKFQELWSQDQTYLDKLKVRRGLPPLGWVGRGL